MNKCAATTSKSVPCQYNAKKGSEFCGFHQPNRTPRGLKKTKSEKPTITITFGDVAENHAGMEKIGEMAENGFTLENLEAFAKFASDLGYESKIFCALDFLPEHLRGEAEPGYLLLIKGGAEMWVDLDKLQSQLLELKWDTQALMRGKVVNKHARWNVCFDDKPSEPDYQNGKGRVVAFSQVPELGLLRRGLGQVGEEFANLKAEGNLYYDINSCGIGYHGDTERRKVVAIRLGEPLPFWAKWYQNTEPVSEPCKWMMEHGDLYVMSEKMSGFDWKRKKILTLRHSAGFPPKWGN